MGLLNASASIARLAHGINHIKQFESKSPTVIAGTNSGINMRKLEINALPEIPACQNSRT